MKKNPLQVLIVDDIELNCTFLDALLEDYFKHRVQTYIARDGKEALDIVFSQTIDLVLLDIQMPEMDGFEVAQEIHARDVTRDLPIIFISAHYSDEEFIEKGFTKGAVDFLTKPINSTQIINKVNLFVILKEKTEQLQEKEYEERAIIEHMANGLIAMKYDEQDDDFTIVHANRAFCTLFKKDLHDIVKKNIRDTFRNVEKFGIQNFLFEVQLTSQELTLKKQFFQNDNGDNIWLSLYAYKLDDKLLVVVVRDITTEVIANEKLLRSKEYIQDILDAQENLILITDGVKFTSANRLLMEAFNLKSLDDISLDTFLEHIEVLEDAIEILPMQALNTFEWIQQIRKSEKSIKVKAHGHIYMLSVKTVEFIGSVHYVIALTNIDALEAEREKLEILATQDALTGIANRFKFNLILEEKLTLVKRFENFEFSLIMFDLDHFKSVNDTYGHDVGDEVLIEVTYLISQQIRQSDLLARWGGEEFMIICSKTTKEDASTLAEKLRKVVSEYKKERLPSITLSFGVTQASKDDTRDTLLKRLDNALYKAKESGRNRVEVL